MPISPQLRHAFQSQAKHCVDLGSPFMGRLFQVLADAWPSQTQVGRFFENQQFKTGDVGPAGHSLPLRIAGGLHALVITGKDPQLAEVYPNNNKTTTTDVSDKRDIDEVALNRLRYACLGALERHDEYLLEWVQTAPQTNEVRRSAVLLAGASVALSHIHESSGKYYSLYLSELGASGGLNLHWDQYQLCIMNDHEGQEGTTVEKECSFGSSSPVLSLRPKWKGPFPPHVPLHVVNRAGVDLYPLDPYGSEEDRLRLQAFLWPDQANRMKWTLAAASIQQTPVEQGDAISWLETRIEDLSKRRRASKASGTSQSNNILHLIQHTVAWQYFPTDAQERGRALIEEAGAQATQEEPLAWLSMENDGHSGIGSGAEIILRLWPGNVTLNLGRADFHGRWIDWHHANDQTTNAC